MTHPIARWIVVAAASLMFSSGAYAHDAEQQELFLGFDLPDDYWQRFTEGEFDREYLVTGFRLGYFRTNGQFPLLIVEFDRLAVVVDGGTGQLRLDVDWLVTRRERIVVRLQTLTRDDASEWSDPSESISISAPDAR